MPAEFDPDRLPPLSPRATELLALRIDDDDAERRLLRIVSGEPQLAGRLVGLANSAAFGLSRVRFATVPLALRRIGLRRAAQLSVAMLFGRPFASGISRELREDLWRHALAMAACAAEIARLKQHRQPGEAYLAGLLHDLGYLLLELAAPGALARIGTPAGTSAAESLESELADRDHAAQCARLLAHWGLPADLVEAMRTHHQPQPEASALAAWLFGAEKLLRLEPVRGALLAAGHRRFAGFAEPAASIAAQLRERVVLNQDDQNRLIERVLAQIDTISGCAAAVAAD